MRFTKHSFCKVSKDNHVLSNSWFCYWRQLDFFFSPGNAVQILIAVIFIDSIPMCFRVHNLLLICLEEHHRLIHRKICWEVKDSFCNARNRFLWLFQSGLCLFKTYLQNVSFKKGVLKYFANFIWKHLCWSLFLKRLESIRHLFWRTSAGNWF